MLEKQISTMESSFDSWIVIVVTAYCCNSPSNWQLNGWVLQKIITLVRAFSLKMPSLW